VKAFRICFHVEFQAFEGLAVAFYTLLYKNFRYLIALHRFYELFASLKLSFLDSSIYQDTNAAYSIICMFCNLVLDQPTYFHS
jgi:hypothetical protein